MSKTFPLSLNMDQFEAIFGPMPTERDTGRSRLCGVCGDWHSLKRPWPHNCRSEPPPRANLAAPQIAPKFDAFQPIHGSDIVINDRREKQDYMAERGLVEFDAGITPDPEPTDREFERQFVADWKMAREIDPLNKPPAEVIGQTDMEGGSDIDVTDIEVAK